MKKKQRTHAVTLVHIKLNDKHSKRRYTREEESLILYSDLDDYTLALELKRTVHAIQNKRYYLLKNSRIKNSYYYEPKRFNFCKGE